MATSSAFSVPFSKLPPEINIIIHGYLTCGDILACSRVCKSWRAHLHNEQSHSTLVDKWHCRPDQLVRAARLREGTWTKSLVSRGLRVLEAHHRGLPKLIEQAFEDLDPIDRMSFDRTRFGYGARLRDGLHPPLSRASTVTPMLAGHILLRYFDLEASDMGFGYNVELIDLSQSTARLSKSYLKPDFFALTTSHFAWCSLTHLLAGDHEHFGSRLALISLQEHVSRDAPYGHTQGHKPIAFAADRDELLFVCGFTTLEGITGLKALLYKGVNSMRSLGSCTTSFMPNMYKPESHYAALRQDGMSVIAMGTQLHDCLEVVVKIGESTFSTKLPPCSEVEGFNFCSTGVESEVVLVYANRAVLVTLKPLSMAHIRGWQKGAVYWRGRLYKRTCAGLLSMPVGLGAAPVLFGKPSLDSHLLVSDSMLVDVHMRSKKGTPYHVYSFDDALVGRSGDWSGGWRDGYDKGSLEVARVVMTQGATGAVLALST